MGWVKWKKWVPQKGRKKKKKGRLPHQKPCFPLMTTWTSYPRAQQYTSTLHTNIWLVNVSLEKFGNFRMQMTSPTGLTIDSPNQLSVTLYPELKTTFLLWSIAYTSIVGWFPITQYHFIDIHVLDHQLQIYCHYPWAHHSMYGYIYWTEMFWLFMGLDAWNIIHAWNNTVMKKDNMNGFWYVSMYFIFRWTGFPAGFHLWVGGGRSWRTWGGGE